MKCGQLTTTHCSLRTLEHVFQLWQGGIPVEDVKLHFHGDQLKATCIKQLYNNIETEGNDLDRFQLCK
jgi:hypothetical protein